MIIDKYADLIYSVNPDLMHYLPKRTKFLPYTCINLVDSKAVYVGNNEQLHIVHAPTNRLIKGTEHITRAIKKLKKNHVNI